MLDSDSRAVQREPLDPARPAQAAPRVADLVADQLFEAGVRHVFSGGGDNIDDLYDAVQGRAGMTAVVAKHEFSAAAMADGYARVGGRPRPVWGPSESVGKVGVVMAGSGGGCLQLVAGLGESFASRVPVLALVGQPPAGLAGFGAFGDGSGRTGSLDVAQVLQSVSVFCRRAHDPSLVANLVEQALEMAVRLSGPAVVILPKDVQQARAAGRAAHWGAHGEPIAKLRANGLGLIGFATELAKAAPQVVIIAGDEVGRHGARAELADLARVLGASVAVAPDAKDVISPVDRHLIGVAGSMGHPQVGEAVRAARVCLLVGTRAPEQTRCGLEAALKGVEVLSLGERPPHIEAAHLLTTDLRGTLRALCKALRPMSQHRQPSAHPPVALAVPARSCSGVGHADVVAALDEAIAQGSDVVVDVGSVGTACVHRLPCREEGRFVVALGAPVLGYSFGAGIGCAFARGRRTFVIAGDGAFYAHGMELHTAIEHHLPITFVICNNNAHGKSVVQEQLFHSGEHGYHRFRPASIAAGIAAMFPGLSAVLAQTLPELRRALADTARSDGPALVEVLCDPDEIPPFLPFLAALR
ncbi:MAG: thiamine pyrophosphate-binding protein [Segniliparus sp.]|uniref:thiamine pyrophosphate-binding protein n=1 Tax=Segniliparus sp. TaxID=2804064 RepID=UPI003F37FA90